MDDVSPSLERQEAPPKSVHRVRPAERAVHLDPVPDLNGGREIDRPLLALSLIVIGMSAERSLEGVYAKASLLSKVVPQIEKCVAVSAGRGTGELGIKFLHGLSDSGANALVRAASSHQLLMPLPIRGQSVIIPDLGSRTDLADLLPIAQAEGFCALWVVPLPQPEPDQTVLGWLLFGFSEPYHPSQLDRAFGTLFAAHLAAAVRHATILEEKQRQVEDLSRQVSQVKETHSEMVRQKDELDAVFQNVSTGFMIMDEHGYIMRGNPALEVITGYREEELFGRKCCDVLGADCPCLKINTLEGAVGDSPNYATAGEAGAKTAPPQYVDFAFTRKDGRQIDISIGSASVVSWNEKPELRIITVRDISHRRQLERRRSDMVSTVSHDLRTFLTAIKGYAATLRYLEEETSSEQKRHYLEAIDHASNRISHLVSDMLELARIEAGTVRLQKEPVYLDGLVADLVSEAQAQTLRHVIRLRCEGLIPPVVADRHRMEQVIINLLDNAIKYSPSGGAIDISVSSARNKRELARFLDKGVELGPCRNSSTWVIVSVKDHGVGVPADQVRFLFDKFFQADNRLMPRTKGVGLGLFICKAIIDAHQGCIWAKSRPGGGLAIAFLLPAALSDLEIEDW